MKNGTSQFNYTILEDTVTLNVYIDWDEYGEPDIEEVTIDGYDVTEEVLSFGLRDKLIDYAEQHEEYFTRDEESRGDFRGD